MSLSQFSKDHGKTILGTGSAILGVSMLATAWMASSRFDRTAEIIDTAPAVLSEMRSTADYLEEKIIKARESLPEMGTEFGEASANAANRASEVLKQGRPGGLRDSLRRHLLERLNGPSVEQGPLGQP